MMKSAQYVYNQLDFFFVVFYKVEKITVELGKNGSPMDRKDFLKLRGWHSFFTDFFDHLQGVWKDPESFTSDCPTFALCEGYDTIQ